MIRSLEFDTPQSLQAPHSDVRRIKLPGKEGRTTTQLGFGCAYLLAGGADANKSRRLLDTAWNAGIRHFDVARRYGQGRTEALLGKFLREHPEATVTTKYGLFPPGMAERIAVAIQRRIPGLHGRILNPNRRICGRFDGTEARESLERSLRLLGRECIDLFLLHEPEAGDLVHEDLLRFLEAAKEQGKIGDYGIGGEYSRIPELTAQRGDYCRVLQLEWSVLGPDLDLPGAYRIHYRVFAKAAKTLGKRFEQDPAMAQRWSEAVGEDLNEPAVVSRLLLRAALDAWPDFPVLFSTRSEDHIFANVKTAGDERLRIPAARLVSLLHAPDA